MKTNRPDRVTLGAFALIVLLGGASAVAVRISNSELPPFWGATMRFGCTALVFWVMALAGRIPLPRSRALVGVLIYGVLNFAGAYGLFFWGLVRVQASVAQVAMATVPLLTFLLALVQGLERFRWQALVGAALSVTGIAIAFAEQQRADVPWLSLLALVGSAACVSEGTVVLKRTPQSHVVVTNALAITTGTVLLAALSLATGETWRLPESPQVWAALAYMIVLGTFVVFYLFMFVVRRWTASAMSYQFVLMPFVTVVVAGWLLAEELTAGFAIGGALVLAGVWFGVLTAKRGRANEAPKQTAAVAPTKPTVT